MRLLFSEANSDYDHYIFPYAIWALPEEGEEPWQIMEKGFLPGAYNLERFYLCRQIRVDLASFELSSENRRILRKGEGIEQRLVPRKDFEFTPERREFFKTYADIKFGKDIMTNEKLDRLFAAPVVSHVLLFTDNKTGREVGAVTLYLAPKKLAYYYYSFYDLNYYARNLGMYMMTSAVDTFSRAEYRHLYLGTCYSRAALYKAQFKGAEFFNGFTWSKNLKELNYMIERDQSTATQHLCESVEYRELFWDVSVQKTAERSAFRISLKGG
ncbi:MAG: hypothetical protein SFY81_17000 [Verrucomicrobiota bacterium]|nr:hypothetical protein [Verrucomicrobiota bacterium]